MFTGLMTLNSFGFHCWRSVPRVISLGEHALILSGRGGPGFILFVIGICLKLTDVLAHLLVPTPAAKRRPVEHDTSFKAYLDRCPEPTTFGALKMGTLESGPEAEPAEEATAYAPPLAGTNAN